VTITAVVVVVAGSHIVGATSLLVEVSSGREEAECGRSSHASHASHVTVKCGMCALTMFRAGPFNL